MAGAYPCPECGKPLRRQKGKDGAGVYWACFNKEGHASGEAVFMDDKGGKPVWHPCPQCGYPLRRCLKKDSKSDYYWVCRNDDLHQNGKRLYVDDKAGKPDFSSSKKGKGGAR